MQDIPRIIKKAEHVIFEKLCSKVISSFS